MDVTVEGDLSTANNVGYDGGGGSSGDPTKKPTFAEKLMGVKNTQCDHYLNRMQTALHNEENRSMVRIREDANKIRYDFKEMEVLRKQRDLESKKKRHPFLDTEEDEFELARAQRYLFYNPNQCFYMDKKNMIPLRGTAKSDPYHVTPTVARARKIMQDMINERNIEAMQEKRVTMLSRKSARSVRFQSREDDEDFVPPSIAPYNDNSKMRPKSMKQFKSTPSATSMYDESETNGLSKQQQLIAYLKRTKLQSSKYESLVQREPGDDIPDDFTQCLPVPPMTSPFKPNSGYDVRSQHEFSEVDGMADRIMAKPSSGYSRRSHAISDDDSVFHLPSLPGDHSRHGDAPEAVQFGAIEELPPHEVALLKQAKQQAHPQPGERPVKSAIVRRTPTKMSFVNRRYTSTSAHPMKRRQVTHAMLRQEKAEVDTKLSDFLGKFDTNKPKPKLGRRTSQPAFIFQAKAETTNAPEKTEMATKPSVQWQTPSSEQTPRTPRPNNPRGIPHHSQDRSKRHTATFKLRRIVEELMKHRTTSQVMEYEKMRAARAAGAKTPDLREYIQQDSRLSPD